MFNNNGVRPAGVVSTTRPNEAAPTRKLTHCAPAQMYAIEYGDDDGKKHTTVAMCIGGVWYLPPNGEDWARSLRPVPKDSWLEKQLGQARSEDQAAVGTKVPSTDVVDVLADSLGAK